MSDSSPEYISLNKRRSMRSSQKYRSSPKSSSSSKGKTLVSKSGVSMKFRSASSSKSRKNTSSASLSNLNKIATLKNEISRLTEEKSDLDFRIFSRNTRIEAEHNSNKYQIQKKLWSLEEAIPEAVNSVKKAEDTLKHFTDEAVNSMFRFLTFSDSRVEYWTKILDQRTDKLESLLKHKEELLNKLDNLEKKFNQSKKAVNEKDLSKFVEISKIITEKHKLLNEEMKKVKRVSKPMTKSEKDKIVNMLTGSPVSI